MQIFFELLANGSFHLRWTMPRGQAAGPAREIKKAVAVHVFDHGTFGTRGENRRRVKGPTRHSSFAALHPCFAIRARNFGAKLNAFHCGLSLRGSKIV